MSTKDHYQVMPPLSPEEDAALSSDIETNGVKNPINVDEEDNTLDGLHRRRICEELGIDCPKEVIPGLTKAQKREHAWRMNLMRRQLSKAQKRMIAGTLWEEGWTQDRIAQASGVSQSTIASWLPEFINSDKLPHSPTVQGKDGKYYPRKKERRRTSQLTEGSSIPDTPFRSDADDRSAQELEQGETPRPRGANPKTQSPSEEPKVASDAREPLETPPPVTDEFRGAAREQPGSALGSGQVPSAEDGDEAHWIDALQDLAVRLETLQVQGGLLPLSTRWAPETRARGMATIRHMKEICIELEAVFGVEMCETADRNGHDDPDVTPTSVLLPIDDEAQEYENHELVTVSSAEEPVGHVAGSNQPPSTRGEITGPVPGASATLTEISGSANVADPVEPCSPDVLLNRHCPDHDCPEQASDSQEACLDGSLLLVRGQPLGSAGTGNQPTANVPMAASAAPLPLCPQCDSSKTWRIYGARAGRFACMNCLHNFHASTPGDVQSTPSRVSSHEMVQVASA